jgi:putative Mg2+ transporter-C (MgtC) family protein
LETLTNLEVFERLGLALLLGSVIGIEREWNAKPAGIRTYALVCQGSALFMLVGLLPSEQLSGSATAGFDPSRVASTVAQGVGFIAGGAIFGKGGHVRGLTTAAGIWVTAALGLMIGAGFYIPAVMGVGLAIFVLVPLRWVERKLVRERRPANSTTGNGAVSAIDGANV